MALAASSCGATPLRPVPFACVGRLAVALHCRVAECTPVCGAGKTVENFYSRAFIPPPLPYPASVNLFQINHLTISR